MTFDPKYFTGDIIASINVKECTVEELIERFDNSTNGILYQLIVSKVDELVSKQLLHENKNGVLKCTSTGRKYITDRGYLS